MGGSHRGISCPLIKAAPLSVLVGAVCVFAPVSSSELDSFPAASSRLLLAAALRAKYPSFLQIISAAGTTFCSGAVWISVPGPSGCIPTGHS
ncbi:hypothetical protein FKM82_020319 [Ascaphus truei]